MLAPFSKEKTLTENIGLLNPLNSGYELDQPSSSSLLPSPASLPLVPQIN
jgi:hypothetical protein